MRRPDQPALTEAGAARVTMPFLPTLAVIALLGVASFYCPSSNPNLAALAERALSDPLTTASLAPVASAPAATSFVPVPTIAAAAGRLPATLAFAEAFPLDDSASQPARSQPHVAAVVRPAPRLAANRRPCPGRRCPETPLRGTDPFAAAHAEAADAAGRDVIPGQALPFADAVADAVTESVTDTLAPAARVVGDAAELMRTGAAVVRGSVSLAVADCLR
ncbi:hypothetical protein MKK84_13665 [Methylobacterium sp. E-065]|uniref:hypothetical protein n=1 Tax=Methylobacterium sp. E-065 TaxID=2836583 RepID=UPI001FBB5343|nr:hypothetical protein [Methylobacterium sp. E-065]MCJ2018469.1 hypothetical protein [Methylobacterium sp. E-065]